MWLCVFAAATAAAAAAAAPPSPRHFVVALVDDLGGYNVPWRNPETTKQGDLQLFVLIVIFFFTDPPNVQYQARQTTWCPLLQKISKLSNVT